MPSIIRIASVVSALLAVAHGQGVIKSAQGTTGSPASLALQTSLTGNDANIINATEIGDNIVNECGRTLLAGNIDIGQNTENQLANKTVTSVTAGGKVAVAITQGSAAGAGPYTCDIDQTSNSIAEGQIPVNVTEGAASGGTINLELTMPSNLACVGASTGNVCTVRCFNSAAAGPFGGCFAVKQTDITAKTNTVDNIPTAQTLAGIQTQVLNNQADVVGAVGAIQAAGDANAQGKLTAAALLKIDNLAKRSAKFARSYMA